MMRPVSPPRFCIGERFQLRKGKHRRDARVVDILKTFNAAGELVRVRYVAEYEFAGQTVTDSDICDTTLARALAEEHSTR